MSEQPQQVPVRGHYRTVGGGGGDEPGPGAGAAPAPQQGGGGWFSQRMIGGVPNWALVSVAALAAIGIFMWYRSRQSAKTASQQQAAANPVSAVAGTGASTAGQCYDASGNPVPCTQADYASQIAALQAEIDSMTGQASVPATYPPGTTTPAATTQAVQPAVGSTQAAGTSAAVPAAASAGAG